jgi:protein gp37
MNKTNIDWPGLTHTWNPFSGCRRGCGITKESPKGWCYARRIHERFNKIPFSEIQYHPSRMDDLLWLGNQKEVLKIFVGSMSDIQYWPQKETEYLLKEMAFYHRHKFMFLTKGPHIYENYNFPINCILGMTITGMEKNSDHLLECLLTKTGGNDIFISFEPILGKFPFNQFSLPVCLKLVIVGAMTGPGAIPPKPEWIQSIKTNVPADKIYWKRNIKPHL